MHKSVKQTNQGLKRPFGKMKWKKERRKPKLIFSMSVWQFFIIFAANPYKSRIEAQILLVKKQKHSTEIKTIKI